MLLNINATINLPNDELIREYQLNTYEDSNVDDLIDAIRLVHPDCTSIILVLTFSSPQA